MAASSPRTDAGSHRSFRGLGGTAFRLWPHVLVIAFLHVGYHRAQFSDQERVALYHRFLNDPVGASLADPIAAVRVHHVRDGDEYLYLCWANLMLGRPVDADYLREESDRRISLLPFSQGRHLFPYRDFFFQYPPLAAIPMVLPALITSDAVLYPYAFGALAGIAALVIVLAGWAILHHLPERNSDSAYLWLSALALFLVGVTLETRLDVLAAAIVAVALWAAVTGRWSVAGILLGIGAAVKIYPALLLPAFMAPLIAQRQYRRTVLSSMGFVAGAVLSFLPGILASWTGFRDFLLLQGTRGLQIESVAASVVAWTQLATGSPLETIRSGGAYELIAGSSSALPSLCRGLVFAMALAGAMLCWRAVREDPSRARSSLIDGVATVIAGIWIASPVLSPQYLVWGLPVLLFVNRRARLLYLVALGMTRIAYPAGYPFIAAMGLPGVILVTIRNGILIAAWALLVARWLHPSTRRPSDIASVRWA